jgi:hypothetical protein
LVAVYDTEAALVASTMPGGSSVSAIAATAPDSSISRISMGINNQPVAAVLPVSDNKDFGFSTADAVSVGSEKQFSVANTIWPASVAVAASEDSLNTATTNILYQKWHYVALILILLVSIAGLFVVPRRDKGEQ